MTEEELMKKFEHKLNEVYAGANTKSKRKRIARDLVTFGSLCYLYFGIDKEYDWDFDHSLIHLTEDSGVKFVQKVMFNSSFYEKMFKNVVDTFISVDFPFYKDYYRDYNRIPDYEFQDIIFSFLNSYDPKLLKNFKEMLENGNVFCADLEDCQGFTFPCECLNKNFVFYEDSENTVGVAATVVHEYGHCFEMNNFYNTGATNFFDKAYRTPYYEISSKFFGYAFLRYLKENNIYKKDAEMRLGIYYIDLLINSFNINLLKFMEQIEINEEENVNVGDDTLVYAREIQEKLNYYDIVSSDEYCFNYRSSYIYGLGSIYGIYLYDNYKKDPSYFKKEFQNALLSYPYSGNLDSFERIGVNFDVLTSCKVLKRVLEDSK